MSDSNSVTRTDAVLRQIATQSLICDQLGSPFTGRVLRAIGAGLDETTAFGRTVRNWPGDPFADNLALRATGVLHALARSGRAPQLTAAYPPNEADDAALWSALSAAISINDAELVAGLASAPQTNEVARSALLLGAMLHLSKRTGLPLALYEIGASAGLNLGFDRYRYRLGDNRSWGSPHAPLTIDCDWRGSTPPLDTPLTVVSRAGCDVRPLDPANHDDAERLMSYIWADQTHRLERTAAALALAAAEHRRIDRDDAAAWLERQWAAPQAAGTCRVLFHTIVWQYMPPDTQARITALLDRLGAAATKDKPLARFAFEQDGNPQSGGMRLTLWPTGETIELGRGDFHGRWAEWA